MSHIPNMPGRGNGTEHPDLPPLSTPGLHFLHLPAEIHSQIATYLTLEELIPFLSLNSALLALTSSHLSPFPALIRASLDKGSPYPPILAKLPSLTLLQPDEDGTLFLDVLVRARPRWILERLELGRWTEAIWKEAFERRFLPSWKRYKLQGDSWRAVFLRLEHRNTGCTHDESWTRFITLNRNGSASINRIYSRQFDPYQIYDELKHQNNFASEPTTVRVVVHLQDLRNAHDLLHPPLLREFEASDETISAEPIRKVSEAFSLGHNETHHTGIGSINPSNNNNEIYYPLVRSLSPSGPQTTTYGLADPTPTSTTPAPRRATFSSLLSPSLLKTRRLSAQNVNAPMAPYPTIPRPVPATTPAESKGRFAMGSRLTLTRSRESDDGSRSRKWSLGSGRRHSGEEKRSGGGGGTIIPASALFSENPYGSAIGGGGDEAEGGGSQGRIIRASALFSDYSHTSVPSAANTVPGPSILSNPTPTAVASTAPLIAPHERIIAPPPASSTVPPSPILPAPLSRITTNPTRRQLPYAPMRKPQPAPSHRLYPNHTPSSGPTDPSMPTAAELFDRRPTHPTVEDDFAGNLWASRRGTEEDPDGIDGEIAGGEVEWTARERFVEWDEEGGRKRWVGPMLIMAQLHPSHHTRAQPPGVDPTSPTEGPDPDLGPKGMYASLGFEDLEAIMGWVELKGGGAYVSDPRKGGMGFDGV